MRKFTVYLKKFAWRLGIFMWAIYRWFKRERLSHNDMGRSIFIYQSWAEEMAREKTVKKQRNNEVEESKEG